MILARKSVYADPSLVSSSNPLAFIRDMMLSRSLGSISLNEAADLENRPLDAAQEPTSAAAIEMSGVPILSTGDLLGRLKPGACCIRESSPGLLVHSGMTDFVLNLLSGSGSGLKSGQGISSPVTVRPYGRRSSDSSSHLTDYGFFGVSPPEKFDPRP
jgi:hypothetical protein